MQHVQTLKVTIEHDVTVTLSALKITAVNGLLSSRIARLMTCRLR